MIPPRTTRSVRADLHHVALAARKARSVVIGAHVRPDGDAVGSVLALTLALREAGIPAVPTLADAEPAPYCYEFLPGFGLYVPAGDLEPPDLFIALDTPNPERLGDARPLFDGATQRAVIDHHPDATHYGDLHVLDAAAAATGELVWESLEALGVAPTADIALCCYVALITDTGRFQYDNTTALSLRVAADMIDAGVNPSTASRLVFQNARAEALELEARTLARLTLANGGRVAYSWITDKDFEETGARPEETEHLPDAIRRLGGIDVSLLFRVHDGEVRGNLRAKTGADVGTVARQFGGGGHRAAAGFTWTGTLEALLAEMLPLLPGGDRG